MTELSPTDKESLIRQELAPAAGIIAALVVLYLISTVNYVLFHSIAEIITIVISFSIFILVWNSRKYIDNAFFLVVGTGFLFSGGIDLVHMLAYKGMGVFPGNSSDLPTQLWIAARYLQAFSLLIAPLAIGKKVRFSSIFIIFGIAFVALLGAIFTGIFPHCFIEGTGLTPFKIGSEYVISILLAASMVLLYRHRRSFDKTVLNYLLWANALTIAAELAFTSYISVYGFANMFGHLLRFVAVYLWYRAFFVVGQKRPFDMLWRELKENEERFFGLFDTISSGVAIYEVKNDGLSGRDYIIKDFNRMALQLEGCKKEEVIGKSLFDLRPTIDDYGLIPVLRKVWKTGVPEYYPQKIYVDEKFSNWYENRIFRLQSGEVVAVYNDVTDQKQTDEVLRGSEEKYRSLFEYMLDGYAYCRMLFDDQGRPVDFVYLEVNSAFEQLTGLKNVTGKRVSEVIPGIQTSSPELFEAYGRVALTGKPERFEIDFKSLSMWLSISVYSPKKGYFVAVFDSITDRKQAEEKLKFSNVLLSTQQEVSIDGILVVDGSGKIISFNTQFIEIWRIPTDVIASRSDERALQSVLDKLVDPGEFLTRVRYLYDHKEERSREEIVLKDGRVLDRYSTPMFGIDRQYFGRVWFFRDITEQKKAEELLKRFNEELEKQVKARTEELNASLDEKVILLREIHHRVKNNLQIIISLLNLQSRSIEDPKTSQAIMESQNRVRAMAIVHEKLHQSTDLSHIDLDGYIRFLGNSLFQFYKMSGTGIIFNTRIQDIKVGIDTAIPLGLIINELVSNSLKHAFPDEKRGEISLAITRENGMLNLIYKDNGIGIPADFDWRNSKSLGIRLVTSLVEQLQGTIELDRSAGTAFTIVVKERE